ncbi:MAG: FAD-dependent oxidoreductase [Nitrospira sp.]
MLILGGGIAGLTAALSLAAKDHSVTVVEQDAHLGGRMWHAPPPILLEAHGATWSLIKTLGQDAVTRPLRHTPLEFLQSTGARIQFLHLPLPSPLNTLLGTTLFQGLSMRDRWHLLSFLERTWEQDPPLPNDLDSRVADEWLTSIGQSETARHGVWNSLARLLLGVPARGHFCRPVYAYPAPVFLDRGSRDEADRAATWSGFLSAGTPDGRTRPARGPREIECHSDSGSVLTQPSHRS